MVALLPVFLVASTSAESVGLGVSDLSLNVAVIPGETKKFEVARLYNTGDFDLKITSTWTPNYSSSGILIEVTPNPLYLIPEKSALVYLKVTVNELGNYSGYVDFSCDVKLPENYTGNPSVPGGRAHAVFNVVEKPPTPIPPAPILPMMEIIAGIITGIIGVVVILIWYFKHAKIRVSASA